MIRLILLVLGILALAACNGQAPPADEPQPPPDAVEEEEDVLEGTLGGDPQLEGGCAWLDTDEGRFEVLYPEGYQIAFDPVRLIGPDGDTIAEEGDLLRIQGRVSGDIMTICQVGTVFEADEVLTAG